MNCEANLLLINQIKQELEERVEVENGCLKVKMGTAVNLIRVGCS